MTNDTKKKDVLEMENLTSSVRVLERAMFASRGDVVTSVHILGAIMGEPRNGIIFRGSVAQDLLDSKLDFESLGLNEPLAQSTFAGCALSLEATEVVRIAIELAQSRNAEPTDAHLLEAILSNHDSDGFKKLHELGFNPNALMDEFCEKIRERISATAGLLIRQSRNGEGVKDMAREPRTLGPANTADAGQQLLTPRGAAKRAFVPMSRAAG